MPPGFELAPEALTSARVDVDRAHATLAAALGDVTADVTSLVGDGWRGVAATAFGTGFDEWRQGAEQVLDALTRSAAALDATRTTYGRSDTAAGDVFTRLDARLGGGV